MGQRGKKKVRHLAISLGQKNLLSILCGCLKSELPLEEENNASFWGSCYLVQSDSWKSFASEEKWD